MTLFSSLRGRTPTSSDEKDHDSDNDHGVDNDESSTSRVRTPLLLDPSSTDDSNNDSSSGNNSFSLRIKLNDGKSTIDFSLDKVSPNITTVQKLKERILSKHFTDNDSDSDFTSRNRYLRLIVRGRMMAPDTSKLETFSIAANDVIHAVLAKEGVRGGQQARMLRRLNHHNTTSRNNSNSGAASSGTGAIANSANRSQQSLWRRIGIDSNGVVVSSQNNENDETDEEEEDSEEDESDFEDAHGEIDLEMGNTGTARNNSVNNNSGSRQQQRRRRRRERRGFDRLRATGMTRDEVTAIRLYFARSVDRYIERRRVMIRASQRLRNSLNDIVNAGGSSSTSSRRQRANTGESTNSLLDTEDDSENTAEGGENSNSNNEGGNNSSANNAESGDNSNNSDNNENITYEGEEILTDRLRMEDEWMATQGPYSEFRMNLNTSNPLLLAAITGGGAGNGTTTGAGGSPLDRTPAGLFFRSRNTGMGGGLDGLDDEDEEMFGGSFTPNGTFVRGPNGSNGFHPYMGPLPSAGTDKDFVWGFILGFFVGFIMLFWVWMPTVPHKQKIGIISGISFQLGLNLLRKSGQGGGTGVL